MQKLLIDYGVPGMKGNGQLIEVQFDCKRIKSYIKLNKIKKAKNLDMASSVLS